MPANLWFNPISLVIDIYNDLYDDGTLVEVYWCEGLRQEVGPWGSTHFPDDPKDPYIIEIDVETPMEAVVEVLGHELAHVAAGYDAGHGEKWERIFSEIHQEYVKRVKSEEIV